MEKKNERTIAQEIVREFADLALKCLADGSFGVPGAGIMNALIAYEIEVDHLEPNIEGQKIARETMREEAQLIARSLTGLAGGKTQKALDGIVSVMEQYLLR